MWIGDQIVKRVAEGGFDFEMGVERQPRLFFRKPELGLVIVKNIQRVRIIRRIGGKVEFKELQFLGEIVPGAQADHGWFQKNLFAINIAKLMFDLEMHKNLFVFFAPRKRWRWN